MSGLGSIYETEDAEMPVGKDLRWNVSVPSNAVGTGRPTLVRVPLRIPDDDGYVVARRVNPADEGDTIQLQVPDVPFPVQLRLRGMGAPHEEGRPGDLILTVSLGGSPVLVSTRGLNATRWAGIGVGLIALCGAILAVCG